MTRSVMTAVALFLSFLAGGWLLSGVGSRAAEDPKTQPKFRGQLYPKWRELGLTDDQKQRIYKIQSEYRSKIDELEKKAKELRSEERSKAAEVLTPAQKARLKELLSGTAEPTKDKAEPAKDKPPAKDKSDSSKDK
jgi:Spy/CpxP family protein refolding chaperone